jgi:hypothetical protein
MNSEQIIAVIDDAQEIMLQAVELLQEEEDRGIIDPRVLWALSANLKIISNNLHFCGNAACNTLISQAVGKPTSADSLDWDEILRSTNKPKPKSESEEDPNA